MKQIIKKWSKNKIAVKYYVNNKNKKHGLQISYCLNSNIFCKTNFVNGKEYGLETSYKQNRLIGKQIYYL